MLARRLYRVLLRGLKHFDGNRELLKATVDNFSTELSLLSDGNYVLKNFVDRPKYAIAYAFRNSKSDLDLDMLMSTIPSLFRYLRAARLIHTEQTLLESGQSMAHLSQQPKESKQDLIDAALLISNLAHTDKVYQMRRIEVQVREKLDSITASLNAHLKRVKDEFREKDKRIFSPKKINLQERRRMECFYLVKAVNNMVAEMQSEHRKLQQLRIQQQETGDQYSEMDHFLNSDDVLYCFDALIEQDNQLKHGMALLIDELLSISDHQPLSVANCHPASATKTTSSTQLNLLITESTVESLRNRISPLGLPITYAVLYCSIINSLESSDVLASGVSFPRHFLSQLSVRDLSNFRNMKTLSAAAASSAGGGTSPAASISSDSVGAFGYPQLSVKHALKRQAMMSSFAPKHVHINDLVGSWVGMYPDRCQEITISFNKSANCLIAVKVDGDDFVPSGKMTWLLDLDEIENRPSNHFPSVPMAHTAPAKPQEAAVTRHTRANRQEPSSNNNNNNNDINYYVSDRNSSADSSSSTSSTIGKRTAGASKRRVNKLEVDKFYPAKVQIANSGFKDPKFLHCFLRLRALPAAAFSTGSTVSMGKFMEDHQQGKASSAGGLLNHSCTDPYLEIELQLAPEKGARTAGAVRDHSSPGVAAPSVSTSKGRNYIASRRKLQHILIERQQVGRQEIEGDSHSQQPQPQRQQLHEDHLAEKGEEVEHEGVAALEGAIADAEQLEEALLAAEEGGERENEDVMMARDSSGSDAISQMSDEELNSAASEAASNGWCIRFCRLVDIDRCLIDFGAHGALPITPTDYIEKMRRNGYGVDAMGHVLTPATPAVVAARMAGNLARASMQTQLPRARGAAAIFDSGGLSEAHRAAEDCAYWSTVRRGIEHFVKTNE